MDETTKVGIIFIAVFIPAIVLGAVLHLVCSGRGPRDDERAQHQSPTPSGLPGLGTSPTAQLPTVSPPAPAAVLPQQSRQGSFAQRAQEEANLGSIEIEQMLNQNGAMENKEGGQSVN